LWPILTVILGGGRCGLRAQVALDAWCVDRRKRPRHLQRLSSRPGTQSYRLATSKTGRRKPDSRQVGQALA